MPPSPRQRCPARRGSGGRRAAEGPAAHPDGADRTSWAWRILPTEARHDVDLLVLVLRMRHTVSRAPCAPWYAGPDRLGEVVGEDAPRPAGGPEMSGTTTRGVLFVHSAPAALCPHV